MSAIKRTAMMRRLLTTIGLGIVGLLALGSRAEAQEIQLTGPLAGAPPARHLRLYRDGRFEIAPTMSFTLLDEYERTILFGGRAQYNLTDWLGIGVWGAAGISSPTSLTNEISTSAPQSVETQVNIPNCSPAGSAYTARGSAGCPSFANQTGKINWVFAPQVQVVPFRGKLAIFQKIFVDTDAYLHAGVAFVGLTERADCGPGTGGPSSCSNVPLVNGGANSFGTTGSMAIAPTFGLGLNFYLASFVALGVEYRALPFDWNRSGFDSRGAGPNNNFPDDKITSADQTLKFNQMVTISLGFSLPTKPKVSD